MTARKDDPYHDHKPYHKAKMVTANGDVSPLCAKTPRKLNLSRELWTLRAEAVTCPKCLRLMASDPPPAA